MTGKESGIWFPCDPTLNHHSSNAIITVLVLYVLLSVAMAAYVIWWWYCQDTNHLIQSNKELQHIRHELLLLRYAIYRRNFDEDHLPLPFPALTRMSTQFSSVLQLLSERSTQSLNTSLGPQQFEPMCTIRRWGSTSAVLILSGW